MQVEVHHSRPQVKGDSACFLFHPSYLVAHPKNRKWDNMLQPKLQVGMNSRRGRWRESWDGLSLVTTGVGKPTKTIPGVGHQGETRYPSQNACTARWLIGLVCTATPQATAWPSLTISWTMVTLQKALAEDHIYRLMYQDVSRCRDWEKHIGIRT